MSNETTNYLIPSAYCVVPPRQTNSVMLSPIHYQHPSVWVYSAMQSQELSRRPVLGCCISSFQ